MRKYRVDGQNILAVGHLSYLVGARSHRPSGHDCHGQVLTFKFLRGVCSCARRLLTLSSRQCRKSTEEKSDHSHLKRLLDNTCNPNASDLIEDGIESAEPEASRQRERETQVWPPRHNRCGSHGLSGLTR